MTPIQTQRHNFSVPAMVMLCGCINSTAQAAYPERPIRLVNPYAPGGLTDVVSRLLARHLTEAWGQQVIVDSRGGGGTTIGTEIVVRAPSDGYTLLCTTTAIAMMPSFYPKLSFSLLKDLAPVALVSQVPGALALNPGVPARSVRVSSARETFAGAGLTRLGGTRQEFAAYAARETQRWAEIIRAANIPTEQ